MKQRTIVLISTYGSDILPPYVKEIYAKGFAVDAIILDGELSTRDRQIIEERTRGFFTWPIFFDIEEFEIPTFFVKNHNNERSQALLTRLSPDVIISADTPRIIKKNILSIPSRGIINCHPGLLPEYRGCTCVEWAIYNDDPVGATCHFMAPDIDGGPVIYAAPMPIRKGDRYEKVRADMIYHRAHVLGEGLKKVYTDGLTVHSLPPQGAGNYYKVIPEDKLAQVKEKLVKKTYTHYSS